MTLLAVPNISEGRDAAAIGSFVEVVRATGTRVLDVHSDATHNRSVLTLTGDHEVLARAAVEMARLGRSIDLEVHEGVHPRLGGLDVCPFVPFEESIEQAIWLARDAAAAIGNELGLPVYLYGAAARRRQTTELPDLRRGGLSGLIEKAGAGLLPDEGPREIDRRSGAVCVGARGPLIAFNVWLRTKEEIAHSIAVEMRSEFVRAMGLRIDDELAQVSMNLIGPEHVGIEHAFEAVRASAHLHEAEVIATEIVGLVERRFLPAPDATVARLLLEPDHCLEDRLLKVG